MEKSIKLRDAEEVLIRDLKQEDYAKLTDYVNDLVDEDTFVSINKKVTLDAEKVHVESKIRKSMDKEGVFLIAESQGEILSYCRAEKDLFKEDCNVEIGISVRKDFRGKGLGGILIKELIRLAKERMEFKRIYLCVYSNNTGGIHLYKKLGFEEFAVFKEWVFHRGEYVDKIFMEYREN